MVEDHDDASLLLAGRRVLWPDGGTGAGWVRLRAGAIEDVGQGEPLQPPTHRADWLAPGLVDIHCHGGGGHTFATTDAQEAAAAARVHHGHGTTTVMASLVTAPLGVLESQLRTLAPLVRDGVLAGIHLEGPWLSTEFSGAHDPALLRAPTPGDVDRLLSAADGQLRMVTIAPELPGAQDAIIRLTRAGVTVAVGHTATDADGLRAAADAGARVVTHLCNAMRGIHHRRPGPIVAALDDQRLAIELIVDGVHLHEDVVALVARSARSRLVLVTDAIAAADCADGVYLLGGLEVRVTGGTARLTAGGSIAGSTLLLARAVRGAVAAGLTPEAALTAATLAPAEALELPGGRLQPGAPGDVVLLDDGLQVQQVYRGAHRVIPTATAGP